MSELNEALFERFGSGFRPDESLARYTVARLGGPADAVVIARETSDLVDAVRLSTMYERPWMVLGGGANVLPSDAGYRGVVIINHTSVMRFDDEGHVIADSGVSLVTLARRCMSQGLRGLEWAINVPGTVGGAVINNAGAHDGDMAASVRWVELFCIEPEAHMEVWSGDQMGYGYRTSVLKGSGGCYVVLVARLDLEPGHDPAALNERADAFIAHRKRTQPPGASLGSIFKNPPDDYAGRLIEAAGLKGTQIGGVQISPVHANFFINLGSGTASDYRALIEQARATVLDKLGVALELEIEFIGDW